MNRSGYGPRDKGAPVHLPALLAEFDDPLPFEGVMLFGSGARGQITAYSDLDLVFYARAMPADPAQAYRLVYRGSRLISLSITTLATANAALTLACQAIFTVQGIRDARILRDSETGGLAALKAQAERFTWTPELREQAERAASYELMGNAEEAHKLLQGLATGNDFALLNGAWGIAVAMPRALALERGILSRGDNLFRRQVCEAAGLDSNWTRYHQIAIGAAPGPPGYSPLTGQAIGAFLLYEETTRLLAHLLRPEHAPVVHTAIEIARASGLLPSTLANHPPPGGLVP